MELDYEFDVSMKNVCSLFDKGDKSFRTVANNLNRVDAEEIVKRVNEHEELEKEIRYLRTLNKNKNVLYEEMRKLYIEECALNRELSQKLKELYEQSKCDWGGDLEIEKLLGKAEKVMK